MLSLLLQGIFLAKAKKQSARSAAAKIIHQVLQHKQSLSTLLQPALAELPENQRSLCQHLCYGVLRWQHQLDFLSKQLLRKPLKAKDGDITALILCGLYQLQHMRVAEHAAISETVNACKTLGKNWATGLVNACLRNYQRNEAELQAKIESTLSAQTAHPDWLIQAYQQDWPEQWQAILEANNQQPPMMLRVNQQKTDRESYLERLAEAEVSATALPNCDQGILLNSPCDVARLPGFAEGHASVQDGAAQLVANLLDIQPKQRILDACAAPGGKTCHILETQPENEVLALDIAPNRLERILENTNRLNLTVHCLAADATDPDSWWDGKLFDRILVDAPCSGSGVIRRHPDIKHLRRPDDIPALAEQQKLLLEALWPLVAPNGLLVYTTCSALKQENEDQISAFLQQHPEAQLQLATNPPATACDIGYQRLPGDDDLDGFYYACLRRN